ncbi:MAG TPA: DUF3662 and FHA domain-containing protein, partial [Acidimicrobiales bacterium]|nr:DUF3662 and FHA domain-containing protein [Acidimicrobiales bacterium]
LQQFERRLERLVEGAFAKAFRSGLQPVEIGRRLTREMDLRRTVAPRGTIAPNHFTVAISKADRDRFAPIESELIDELVLVAREHARSEGYLFLGSVTIDLLTDPDVSPGRLLVAGEITQAGGGPSGLLLPDGRRITLGIDPVTIGRLPECDIAVSDPNVSRRHAQVRPADDGAGYLVIDLGSTNGTKVNGIGIRGHRLQHGDEIMVGSTRVRYEAQ